MNPAYYFESFLPGAVGRSSVARVHALTTIVRFRIGMPGRDEWTCRFDRGLLISVARGANGFREEFGYQISPASFNDVVTGRKSIHEVFFQGEAELLGNQERALMMVPVMEAFLREFPVQQD